MKRITALILAVVTVLFCPFSASADGAATTFGISHLRQHRRCVFGAILPDYPCASDDLS